MDPSTQPIEDEQLRRLVIDEGRSFKETARILGVSKQRLGWRARKLGIVSSHGVVKRPQLFDADWVRDQFDSGRSIADVTAELDVEDFKILNSPVRTPVANAFAERWIGSIRRELLDRTIIWNQRQIEHVVDHINHHNTHRPHRSLEQRPPLPSSTGEPDPPRLRIVETTRCDGLINEYRNAA